MFKLPNQSSRYDAYKSTAHLCSSTVFWIPPPTRLLTLAWLLS